MKQYQIDLLQDIADNRDIYTWHDIQDIVEARFMIEEKTDLLSILKSKEHNDFMKKAEKVYYEGGEQ